MNLNKEYKQISVNTFNGNYNTLKGKVIDKVAFTNTGSYDCQMLIIIFTDKTFIAVGPDYNNFERWKDEPTIGNYYVDDPRCINGGDFSVHSWTGNDGKLRFEKWINILRDLDLWQFTDEDAKAIMDKKQKEVDDREYQNYLRLKEKFEKSK